jgi:hypothetical protein
VAGRHTSAVVVTEEVHVHGTTSQHHTARATRACPATRHAQDTLEEETARYA